MNFVNKKIPIQRAITLLTKNGIQVEGDKAEVILNFLYLIASTYCQLAINRKVDNPNETSN